MNKEQFIENYCKRSNLKKEWLMNLQKAIKCDCKEKGCNGWQMVQK